MSFERGGRREPFLILCALCAFLWLLLCGLVVREDFVGFETHLAEAVAGLVDHFKGAAD